MDSNCQNPAFQIDQNSFDPGRAKFNAQCCFSAFYQCFCIHLIFLSSVIHLFLETGECTINNEI